MCCQVTSDFRRSHDLLKVSSLTALLRPSKLNAAISFTGFIHLILGLLFSSSFFSFPLFLFESFLLLVCQICDSFIVVILASSKSSGLIRSSIQLLVFLAVWGICKSLLQYHAAGLMTGILN